MTMNEAARICARLIASGPIPRSEAPELDHPAIREDVETRLHQCGFVLASSPYIFFFKQKTAYDIDAGVMDGPSNLGLGANACALLTVLWAKLVLQKRTAAETQHTRMLSRNFWPATAANKCVSLNHRCALKRLIGNLGASLEVVR